MGWVGGSVGLAKMRVMARAIASSRPSATAAMDADSERRTSRAAASRWDGLGWGFGGFGEDEGDGAGDSIVKAVGDRGDGRGFGTEDVARGGEQMGWAGLGVRWVWRR